jgi:hypothetical protein
MMKAIALLFVLAGLGAASSSDGPPTVVYDIGNSYELKDECADSELQIMHSISDLCTGQYLDQNSALWLDYYGYDDRRGLEEEGEKGEEEEETTNDEQPERMLENGERRLQTCRSLCMAGLKWYCNCCYTCGGWRRRNLRVKVDSRKLSDLEDSVEILEKCLKEHVGEARNDKSLNCAESNVILQYEVV